MVAAGDLDRWPNGLSKRLPPAFDQRIFSPHSIAAIVAELGKQGVDATNALQGTGLSPEQLNSHTTKISYRLIDIVIRNALSLSSDPAIALRAGQRIHLTAYGMYGYALLSSATEAEARDFSARYLRVIGPFCDFTNVHRDGIVVVTLEPFHWPNPTEDTHRFAVEFALSAHLNTIQDRVGNGLRFSRVFLDYPAPRHAAVYESVHECPVLFDQPRCGYETPENFKPLALADTRTNAMAREMCEQLLDDVNRATGLAAEVRRILIEIPGQYPTIEVVAEKLQMYPRALRRRLEAEGTSYRELLGEVRMRLAIGYLRKTEMTNEEIASRLGYSDAANFRHAFSRWTGKSPSDFRVGAST